VSVGKSVRGSGRGAPSGSRACYATSVIRDRAAYERLRVAEEHRELRELDMKSSIAKLEALLTSSLLNRVGRRRPRPLNLVRALGIDPRRVVRRPVRTRP